MSNPAAEARAKVKAAHPEATVHERRANGIIHRLPDAPDGKGRFAGDYFIGPIHYGGPDWQEIDTAFVSSTAPWDWEMTKADFHVHALSRLDAGQVAEYRDGDEWVRFQPMALQYSNDLDQIQPIAMPGNVEAGVNDDTLTWADGYGPGRTLSWQAQTARLAKRLAIQSLSDLPTAEQYILDGGNPVVELNFIFAFSAGVVPHVNGQPWGRGGQTKDRDTQGLVEFRDGAGDVLWWFALPRSWDAEGNEQLGTFRFKKVGAALYVSHRVPLSFVQGAIFPLVVDVDVDDQVDASSDDARETEETGEVEIALAFVSIRSRWSVSLRLWGGVRFDTESFPAKGSTIDAAHLSVYLYDTFLDDASLDIYGEDAEGPTTFTVDGFDITSRTRTTDSASWEADGIAAGGVGWYDSPSIVDPLQELATDYDSTAIVLILKPKEVNDKQICFRSWDFDTSLAAKLHIEYTAAGIGADEMMAAIGPAGGGGGGGSGDIMAHSRKPPEPIAY